MTFTQSFTLRPVHSPIIPFYTPWPDTDIVLTVYSFLLTGSKTSMRHRRCTASWEAWLDRVYRAARDGGLCAVRKMWVLAPSQAVLISSRLGVPKRSVIRSNCNSKNTGVLWYLVLSHNFTYCLKSLFFGIVIIETTDNGVKECLSSMKSLCTLSQDKAIKPLIQQM